ncbi:hypothetical protein PIB30_043342, partial [Stylosanthes scabra]|nr:hypothetical protein [Stylosanthes scabra]
MKLKTSSKPKLDVDERVEVRSMEEGFLGSWHPGKVVNSAKLQRHVKYDNLLLDDEVNYLVEKVNVPKVLDGDSDSSNCNVRGWIRPVPPMREFESRELKYGLCVDVYHEEAWWEGVIFDHCDGMEERSVLFPDLGDEMKIEVHQMRITYDWDEVTGKWLLRGNWVFLELIEEFERKLFVPVSVKQVWYDVRTKPDFAKIREWTFSEKHLWKDMVMEVLGDYLNVTLREVCSFLDLPRSLLNVTPEKELVEPGADVEFNYEVDVVNSAGQSSSNCIATAHCDGTPDNAFSSDDVIAELPMEEGESSNLLNAVQDRYSMVKSVPQKEVLVQKEKRKKLRNLTVDWKPLNLSEVELCPDAVEKYAQFGKSASLEKARKQLVHLGWEIEWAKCKTLDDNYRIRYKYRPPDKDGVYTSLSSVCKYLARKSDMSLLPSQNDKSLIQPTPDNHLAPILIEPPPLAEVADEPEFCPQAVLEYSLNRSAMRGPDRTTCISKARRHLLAEGWVYKYVDPSNKRKGFMYTPPNKGRNIFSLCAACHYCIRQNVSKWTMLGMQALSAQDNVEQIWSASLLQKASQWLQGKQMVPATEVVASSGSTNNRKRKLLENTKPGSSKRRSNGLPRRVLRSNKRVQKVSVPSLSHQKPQNVLSWLIDNNILLPRSKVSYKRKGRLYSAEGRITSDGIKCNCCLKVYSLSGFESHASGFSTSRPAACIILEDGRSLLDCLIKTMQDHMTREANAKPKEDLLQGENDNICSVCHFGGDLILCDQCPSSFHGICLGLEDVPEGDWFCPSCRCAVCGESKIEGAEEEDFLVCLQCEHKCASGLKMQLTLEDIRKAGSVEGTVKRSKLSRLNFSGFYTVLLERNEELISAATIRVYGKKVAEVPLVGTRLQYRRHGMCRILMNELEKRLMQLGVERLVLPAVPSVVETWTGCFGFVKMTEFERSQFLDNTFLDFQGTIMCQKLLMKIPSPDPVLLIEYQQKTQDVFPETKLNFDAGSVSEVLHQAEEADKGEIQNSQMQLTLVSSNDNGSHGVIEQVTPKQVNKPSPDDLQWQSAIVTQAHSDNNGSSYKCYKRRKYTKSQTR